MAVVQGAVEVLGYFCPSAGSERVAVVGEGDLTIES